MIVFLAYNLNLFSKPENLNAQGLGGYTHLIHASDLCSNRVI